MNEEREKIPVEEVKKEIEITSRRIGLLHLAFAETLRDESGEEEGKKLAIKAIKNYGKKIGNEVKKAVEKEGKEPTPENYGAGNSRSLPKIGMHEGSEALEVNGEKRIRAYGCVMAKVWEEYDEPELGRIYCYVDPAKYITYNPDYKLVHTKCIPDGDEYCELTVRKTTKKERENFLTDRENLSEIDKP